MNANSLPVLDRRLAAILRTFVKELNLSAQAYSKIVILARSLADRAKARKIETPHLLEAIQFCTLETSNGD